ncbi:MAG: signal peptidase I [Bacteroidia bacterium]|jgi:signal peptidase I
MDFNPIETFKDFRPRTKIVLIIWTVLNLIILGILLFAAHAPIGGSIIFFLIWEISVWGYYVYRYKYRQQHRIGEWVDAIMFAVIAATVIRSMFIELYQIPTSSMEKSLLVGDFLFVNKVSFGTRLTMTPLSFPFAHHTMPWLGTKAYSEAIKFPYYRLPGLGKIKNGDVVVFNWPDERLDRPVDKKENYIKRCVAIPGDTLTVKRGVIHINGVPEDAPPMRQFSYLVRKNTRGGLPTAFLKEYDITDIRSSGDGQIDEMQLNDINRPAVQNNEYVNTVDTQINPRGQNDGNLFPLSKQHYWSRDFYGPLVIPKKGVTVTLTEKNYDKYERVIKEYENNKDFVFRNGKCYMGDKEITEYTFEMDYYFMMGDNRHYSYDSRFWGFVPENHVVGKAWFVLWSIRQDIRKVKTKSGEEVEIRKFDGIRWKRCFMGIK